MTHIIAIDGLVGTGKGTTAQGIAKKLGWMYLDTGAMYRAVTLHAFRHQLLDKDESELELMMNTIKLGFQHNHETDHHDIVLHDENVETLIRESHLALKMKPISSSPAVRKKLVFLQQQIGLGHNIVVDGRDIGTVVFPQAAVKIFLTCDIDVRVSRRLLQLQSQTITADHELIRKDILHRDEMDYLGPQAINKKADDAMVIDTTHLSIDEQIERIIELYKSFALLS